MIKKYTVPRRLYKQFWHGILPTNKNQKKRNLAGTMPDQYQSTPCLTCMELNCFSCERLKMIFLEDVNKWRAVGWQTRGVSSEGFVRMVWVDDLEKMIIPE